MKKSIYLLCLMAAISLMACNADSYSKQLKNEKKQITAYMNVHGYHIIDTLPSLPEYWGEKDYYRVPLTSTDYCFYHLVHQGDTTKAAIISNETVILRYRRYTLNEPADTLSRWTTLDSPYPTEFNYLTDNTGVSCEGWQIAVKYMQYPEAECKIIVPSKLGFSEDSKNQLYPYGYDMKIKIKR